MTRLRLAWNPVLNCRNGIEREGEDMTLRLAYHPEGGRTLSELRPPTVRLSAQVGKARGLPDKAPTVRLSHHVGAQGDNCLMAGDEIRPALLVSYVYLQPFLKNRHRYSYRDWAMDSGAFSAHNSGTEIKLDDYIAQCKELMASDPTLTEIFSLDVIGDAKESMRNAYKMRDAGIAAIPCYHVGEPEKVLRELAKEFPKIALGGAVGYADKLAWAKQCFARVWPKQIHGFGFGGEKAIMALPWHSVDATNWEIAPCKFGTWKTFGKMSVRGSQQNLRVEVEWYMGLEERARQRWANEMKLLGPTVRLAYAIQRNATVQRMEKVMGKKGGGRAT